MNSSIDSATTVGDASLYTPRTELDSHANMVVLGKKYFLYVIHGKTCEVEPFDPNIGTYKEVPIMYEAIAYKCQFTNKTHLIVIRNSLYVTTI